MRYPRYPRQRPQTPTARRQPGSEPKTDDNGTRWRGWLLPIAGLFVLTLGLASLIKLISGDSNDAQNSAAADSDGAASAPTRRQGDMTAHFTAVSADMHSTCALAKSGNVYCWGSSFTNLGDSARSDCAQRQFFRWCNDAPTEVSEQLNFASLVHNDDRVCGITADGTGYCWGKNEAGLLGTGSQEWTTRPTRVAGGYAFKSLAVTGSNTCGIAIDGRAYCWGEEPTQFGVTSDESCRVHGRITGTADTVRILSCSTIPLPVFGDRTFMTLTASGQYVCGIGADSLAYCWGDGSDGILGVGDTRPRRRPSPVAGGHRFTALSAGGQSTCGITADGESYCWGANDEGQLGTGNYGSRRLAPVRVQTDLAFSSISVGYYHACALTAAGAAYCWGENIFGELGTSTPEICRWLGGEASCSTKPIPVSGQLSFVSISAGMRYTCGVTADGAGYCWGRNAEGQLGYDTSDQQKCILTGRFEECSGKPVPVRSPRIASR